MKAENAWKIYDEKIKQILVDIADYLRGQDNFEVDENPVFESSDEEFAYSLFFKYDKMNIDIQFYLLEKKIREGTGNGLAFGMTICGDGGYIIGGMTPFNYSNDLWTRTYNDLAERFSYFQSDNLPDDTCNVIVDWAVHHASSSEPVQKELPL
jgi:hypothetical protein